MIGSFSDHTMRVGTSGVRNPMSSIEPRCPSGYMTDRAAVKNADRPSGVTSARPIRLKLTTASGRRRSERCRRGAQDRVYFAAEASARDEDQPVQLGGVEATEVDGDCPAERVTGHGGARY